jgi:hypothetical protein
MFKERFIKKSSAFPPVKWERSNISCAFINSKFRLQCIYFSVYWYIHRTELINFSWLNSCMSTNYFCGDFLYFFKHVYIYVPDRKRIWTGPYVRTILCVYSYGLLRAGPYEYVDHIRMLKINLYFHESSENYKLFQ